MTNETNEARVEATRTVHQGRVFRVDVERVRLPGGHVVDMELVRHGGAVVILPLPSPDRIILIRQYRHAVRQWLWEVPAGTLKPGEDPAAAAARECEEEIGLVPGRIEPLRAFYPTPGFCDEKMNFFRCTDLHPPAPDSQVKPDDDENIEPKTFTLDEARAMLERGEIVDMKTALGLMLMTGDPGT